MNSSLNTFFHFQSVSQKEREIALQTDLKSKSELASGLKEEIKNLKQEIDILKKKLQVIRNFIERFKKMF